jgi:hypothetical protein
LHNRPHGTYKEDSSKVLRIRIRRKIELKFKEEVSEVLCIEHSFVWCWKLDTSESRSEIPGKFWNVVLEKDGDQLDWSCKKWRSIIHSQGEGEYPI